MVIAKLNSGSKLLHPASIKLIKKDVFVTDLLPALKKHLFT